MIFFLHEQGYNFFNLPKLTYPEINTLIRAKNRMVKREEQSIKRAQRKSKRRRR
ncbi:MAG: hypothetical protein ACTSXD_11930 [Candidatus Heimdallarchaeaceae archaeon]